MRKSRIESEVKGLKGKVYSLKWLTVGFGICVLRSVSIAFQSIYNGESLRNNQVKTHS